MSFKFNKLSKKMVVAASLLCLSAGATAAMKPSSNARFVGDLAFSDFCQAAMDNDVSMLKRAVATKVGDLGVSRRAVLKKLVASNGMSCDGVSLVEFSKQRGAIEVYAYLNTAQNS